MTVATGLIKLNVGSGNVRDREGYTTLDTDPRMEPDIVATVPPIPLSGESCQTIYASHFIEHLTREAGSAFIAECWRVLVMGGELEIFSPHALTPAAWQDPTHTSFWVPEAFLYHTDHFRYLGYDLETRFQLLEVHQPDREGTFGVRLRKVAE